MRELFLGDDPIPVGNQVGDLIHGLRISGADPPSALDNLREVVEGAGASIDNVAQVSFFVRSQSDLQAINPAWLEVFPHADDRPTYKFMTADLADDRPVHLEFFALAGQRRRPLHLPNVAHTNPIPMGVRIGPYLFSSRVLPYDAATGRPAEGIDSQAKHLFRNVRNLLTAGDARPEHLTQARLFHAAPEHVGAALQHWNALVSGSNPRPALHVTPYHLAPSLLVMLEFISRSPA